MTITLLNAFYDIKITKGTEEFTRDNLPVFFNSISRVELGVRTGEIVTIDITLTPNYNDAMDILRSGLLGINMGSKDQKPEKQGEVKTPSNAPAVSTGEKGLGKVISGFAQVEMKLLRAGEELGSGKPYETKTFRGALTQPDVQIQGSDISITLKGYGNAVFGAGPLFKFSCEGKTIEDVVDACIALIGYSKVVKENQDASVSKKLKEKIIDQFKTDTPYNMMKWALGLQKLTFTEDLENAKQLVIFDSDVSSFKPEKPKYTFVQWRQIDVENNIFPLMSFTVDSARSLFLSGRAFGNWTQGANEKTKEITTNETSAIKDKDDMYKQIENASTVILKDEKLKLSGWISMQANQNSTEQESSSKKETVVGSAVYQKFTLESFGLSDIAPLDQVNLMIGDIKEFSGVLSVTKVIHTMDGDGWKTSLDAVKIADMGQDLDTSIGLPMTEPSITYNSPLRPRTIS